MGVFVFTRQPTSAHLQRIWPPYEMEARLRTHVDLCTPIHLQAESAAEGRTCAAPAANAQERDGKALAPV